jgi:hypothetical protein
MFDLSQIQLLASQLQYRSDGLARSARASEGVVGGSLYCAAARARHGAPLLRIRTSTAGCSCCGLGGVASALLKWGSNSQMYSRTRVNYELFTFPSLQESKEE